ncbi:MAG: DUF2723 domain-containing protein, partial [bacterium]|nr:DUF2723 domain-containing protein [bacterium]
MNKFILFLPIFVFNLYITAPWVACYRDSGEMVLVSKTLSIPHSPGYPFYVLVNKLFLLIIQFGNE